MKKLIILITVVGLFSFTTLVSANGGGEGNNTGCNGQGNANSPCAGQGRKGGSATINNKIKNTISNKINNKVSNKNTNSNSQKQIANASASANNEGVNVGGSSYEDNSVYIAPPSTIPMVGTTSAQITTMFGGVGFSKDAKHAKLMVTIEFIGKMRASGVLTEEQAREDSLKVYDKLLRTVCGRYCVKDRDIKKDDKEVEGNKGNL